MSDTPQQGSSAEARRPTRDLTPRSQLDRRRARRFVLTDKRTGFDRRRRYPVTSTLRDDPRLLLLVLIAVNVLSTLDFLYTLVALDAGVASEGNPVMARLFEQGPGIAWVFKSALVLAVTVVIWLERRRRSAIAVALGALGLYAAVVAYHVYGLGKALAR